MHKQPRISWDCSRNFSSGGAHPLSLSQCSTQGGRQALPEEAAGRQRLWKGGTLGLSLDLHTQIGWKELRNSQLVCNINNQMRHRRVNAAGVPVGKTIHIHTQGVTIMAARFWKFLRDWKRINQTQVDNNALSGNYKGQLRNFGCRF